MEFGKPKPSYLYRWKNRYRAACFANNNQVIGVKKSRLLACFLKIVDYIITYPCYQ